MKQDAADNLRKGRIARLGGAIQRAHEKKRLRTESRLVVQARCESERRFRSVFHNAAAAMAVTLPDGRFAEVNRAYCEMLGYTEEELLATTFAELTHPQDLLDTAVRSHRQLVTGEIPSFRAEKRYLHKHGTIVWCDLCVSAVLDSLGTPACFVSQAHDITARKRAEDELRTLNRELETRVLERTAKLNETVAALEAEILKRQGLEDAILRIGEREQSRLGQDLHDGLGQELAGTAMLGDVLARQLQAESHPLAEAADQVASYIRSTIDTACRISKDLYPVELDRYGLLLALKNLAGQVSRQSGVRCEFRHCGHDPQLPQRAEIHIYRIMQECVANAVKHGKPRHILVESLADDGTHTFAVTDDGVGFEKPAASSGMGLHLIEYRARVIGADITIDQPEASGCRVTCRLAV